jgi:hypothetical protein
MDGVLMAINTRAFTTVYSARRALFVAQIILVLVAWLYSASLHWQNDGLWFQGDAPRHAANGIFWKDFLLSGSLAPVDYALSYYARYPIITPVAYPPAFYILEGIAFAIFHPSPYLAKSLVLLFSLGASLYLLAWIRRWISSEAAWCTALLPLLPVFMSYSNAVMLNVPATALSIAAVYHARRWLEDRAAAAEYRHFFMAAAFSLLAVLVYLPAAIVVFIIAAFLLAERRWDLLKKATTYLVALICAGILIPWIWMAGRWEPVHLSFVTEANQQVFIAAHWSIYAKLLTEITGYYPLVLSMAGVVLGLAAVRLRREMLFLFIIFTVDYVLLTVLVAREARYGLLLCMPVICCCGIACDSASRLIMSRVRRPAILEHVVAAVFGIILVGIQGIFASAVGIPRIHGMSNVVSYVETLAPKEPVFYEGYYDGVFIFYLQSRDPAFRRRAVVGRKLLYANAINPRDMYQQFVHSTEDVIRVLKTQGGCRYIIVERSKQAIKVPAARILHQAVLGPQFDLMRSFPVSGPGLDRIDVYRFKIDPDPVDDIDLIFPALGNDVRFRVRPIQR